MMLIGNLGIPDIQTYPDLPVSEFHISVQNILNADELAFEVLNQFCISRGKHESFNTQLMNDFKTTFLNEIPPPPLYFPIEIIESWFMNASKASNQDHHDMHYFSPIGSSSEYS